MNPISLADLKAWGLGYAFGCDPEQGLCQGHTPDGNTGTVFHDHARAGDSQLAMDVDNQTWDVCADTGCFVGYWNDRRPTPADLARPQQLRGYPAELADGESWIVPLVRNWDDGSRAFDCALPVTMKCGPDGKWTRGQVRQVYQRLWDIVTPFADDFAAQLLSGAAAQVFEDEQVYSTVIELLQATYVVGAGELSLLGALFDNRDIRRLGPIYAACDSPTFLAWYAAQKKTLSQAADVGAATFAGAAC